MGKACDHTLVHTRHIKKTSMVWHTLKTLHSVLLHLFPINLFSAVLITLFTISLSAYDQLFIYFCSFKKSRCVFHVHANCFAPSMFSNLNTNHQIGMAEHFRQLNPLIVKSIFILYIYCVYLLKFIILNINSSFQYKSITKAEIFDNW